MSKITINKLKKYVGCQTSRFEFRRKSSFCLFRMTLDALRLTLCGFSWLLALSSQLLTIPVYAQEPIQQRPLQQGSLDKERLDIIKSDIQKEIQHNEKLKKDIEDARKGMDEATQQRLLKVSKIYEAMAPEEAAKTLEKLDEDTAAAILSNLKPRKAGAILGQMDSEKSASISKKLIVKNPNPK